MASFAAEHGRRVRSIVHRKMCGDGEGSSGSGGSDSRITDSWMRCLNDYRLDPDSVSEPQVVDRVELQQRLDSLADLRSVAEGEMANLYQQLAGSGYAIMLTDSDGVLLNFFGDPVFSHAASRSGLMPGAVWSERAQGTNGMGTCLVERRPVSVHQDEHYLSRNIGLSCAAAPIFNHRGELVAVLDASGESRLAQQHTLALVSASVQMIENRVFLQQFRHKFIVRFHNRPEFVGTLSEGAIALSPTGQVLAATRRALLLLGLRSPAEIEGRAIDEVFKLSFPGLLECCVKTAFHPVPIFAIRNGARFFAVSYAPAPVAGATAGTAANPRAASTPPACTTGRIEAIPADTPLDRLHQGDAQMAHNVQVGKRVMERNVAVMLLGETGTGKELFAQALHRSSSRAQQPFVAINCASIPEALIESELFGYVPGAFTGARKDGHAGKLLHANGGTLFLDEIGDMPVPLQARLLRVLEEREVLPLGGKSPVKLDIRLISATHCDLHAKIAEKQFREDLYYRLHGVAISMPPLRTRGDRRALIEQVLEEESRNDGPVALAPPLLAALERHSWPGNVRQLRQLLRSMVALREADLLSLADLPAEIAVAVAVAATAVGAGDGLSQAAEGAAAAEQDMNPLECAERDALVLELTRHGWNISTLARKLKISRNTLYRKVQRLNITNPDKAILH